LIGVLSKKKWKNGRFAAALALRTSELSASTAPEGPLFLEHDRQ
jgi:hypothetical protein